MYWERQCQGLCFSKFVRAKAEGQCPGSLRVFILVSSAFLPHHPILFDYSPGVSRWVSNSSMLLFSPWRRLPKVCSPVVYQSLPLLASFYLTISTWSSCQGLVFDVIIASVIAYVSGEKTKILSISFISDSWKWKGAMSPWSGLPNFKEHVDHKPSLYRCSLDCWTSPLNSVLQTCSESLWLAILWK